MTGVLEQLVADVAAIKAALNGAVAAAAQPQVDAFGRPVAAATPAATPAAQPVVEATESSIMALVEPYLEIPHVKAALQQDLAAMQIARLPEAKPEQYPELYRRFQATIAANATAAPAATPTSII